MEQAWYEGNVDAYDVVYTTDYVCHKPPLPDVNGLDTLKEYVTETRLAYSDIKVIWHEWIGEGNSIAYRYTMHLTHTGQSPSLPIPPTGKELTLEGCIVAHCRDDMVCKEYEFSDYLGFMQQLGIVPQLA
jgi:predicted ester cyclase